MAFKQLIVKDWKRLSTVKGITIEQDEITKQ